MDGTAVMEAHPAAREHDRSGGVEVDPCTCRKLSPPRRCSRTPCLWEPGTIRTQPLSSVTLSIATRTGDDRRRVDPRLDVLQVAAVLMPGHLRAVESRFHQHLVLRKLTSGVCRS